MPKNKSLALFGIAVAFPPQIMPKQTSGSNLGPVFEIFGYMKAERVPLVPAMGEMKMYLTANVRRIALLVLMLVFGRTAFGAGWTSYASIKKIQLGSTYVYVDLDPALATNINSCSEYSTFPGRYLLYSATDYTRAQAALYSSIQLAAAQKKDIRIWSNGCIGGGFNSLDWVEWQP